MPSVGKRFVRTRGSIKGREVSFLTQEKVLPMKPSDRGALHATWATQRVLPDIVCIIDTGEGRSITNDPHYVCRIVAQQHGDKRILYRDTSGDWDELVHDRGEFVSFKSARELAKMLQLPSKNNGD